MNQKSYGAHLGSRAFHDGGMYILRQGDAYVLFVAHGVGIFGTGAHKHNDWLSLEWCLGSQPILIDPGTGCYTGDMTKKNRYRKTGAHNTVVVDGEEQIPVEGVMFAFPKVSGEVEVTHWQDDEHVTRVSAKHTAYMRLPGSVVHHRAITLNKNTHEVTVEDKFTGDGCHVMDWYFHLDPALNAVCINREFIIRDAQKDVAVVHLSDLFIGAEVIGGSVSHRYNVEADGHILHARFIGEIDPDRPFLFKMCPC